MKSVINGVAIKGISCVLPTRKVESVSYYSTFGKETVDKLINRTGVESVFVAPEKQTASDLAFIAAQRLLESKNVDAKDLGSLIFVTQTPDYRLPSTACVLQYRLGLSENVLCYDINLGCTGFISGLYTVSSLMASSNINNALLLVGETTSKRNSPLDRSVSFICGDCGSAVLLTKDISAVPMTFSFKTFGDRFKKAIIPSGCYRNIGASTERVKWADGGIRSDYDIFMSGADIFSFGISEVPVFIENFLSETSTNEADYDYIVLHQANKQMLKQIAKRLNVEIEKVPITLQHYGNTSVNTVPLAISHIVESGACGKKRLLLSTFGGGLSWNAADITYDLSDTLEIAHSDDFFTGGAVSHD